MIKIGLVGVRRGHIVQNLRFRSDVKFSAACDLRFADQAERETFIEQWKADGIVFEKLYDDFDKFLSHNLDLILIATPPEFHASQSIRALQAGLNVISEVPAVTSIDEAKALVKAVRNSHKKYMFAENCCYWAFVQAWKKMISQGRLGDIFYMEGEYIHDLTPLLKDKDGKPTWRASLEPIRYVTHETGPLFDMIDDRGMTVVAGGCDPYSKPEYNLPNAEVALVKTTKGVLIKLLVSLKNSAAEYHRYLAFGTKGTLETKTTEPITFADFKDIPHLTGRVTLPMGITEPGLSSEKTQSHGSADWRLLNTCIDTIANDTAEPIDVYRGLDYTLVGVCAVESLAQGSVPIEIPDPRKF